ncbi:CDP-glycerol glycerophosphotransferase family protein [Staphylococcus devriesei]|uniref:CDP-glycerol glycerophosphotransferase family protein n=1 Tax=Staphylococcus devriesei TaxID=586733 RepID=UPI002D7F9BEF|nr:CDP-glycerol glycerophosphotransferase family protein [Staphylococcus devriesei]
MQIIRQKGSIIHIDFKGSQKNITKVYVKNEFDSIKYENKDGDFHFEIDLKTVASRFNKYETKKIYIVVEEEGPILTKQKNLKIDNNTKVYSLSKVTNENMRIHPYITKNGYLHLSMNEYTPNKIYFSRRHIDNIKINNHEALIEGQFSILNSRLEYCNILIKTRFTEREKSIKLLPKYVGNTKDSAKYNFSIDIYDELINFIKYPFNNGDVIDIYLDVKVKETLDSIHIKLGNPRVAAEWFLKGEIITDFHNEVVSITPYLTMKGRNLSFRINRYSLDSYLSYIESVKKLNIKYMIKNRANKIWIIGEKSYKAQDNGFHFFKYMRTHHPEIPAYYIIEKDSKEAKNVLPFGNVIFYKSPEHFEIMLKADYICTTHHPELLYPTNSKIYTRKIKATKVFLQHGVLGTKNLTNINGNQLKDFNVDLLITSSNREKEIVVKDLKFDDNQVKVTGLLRFDELFKPNVEVKKQILIIPTWRDWLTNLEQLKVSEYLERMNLLLYSPKLKEIAEKGTKIIFCLHPNMQPFIQYFDVPSYVTIIKQGDVDVQKLIKESQLMITDYSSVAFDFSFLNKPVIYYQFDKERFLGKEPSHIDIEKELPGIIVNSQEEIEKELVRLEANNYGISSSIKSKADQFIKYRDEENSKRIFEEVLKYKSKNKIKSKIKYNILTQHMTNRFRKDKRYFKVMDKFNTVITKFTPVKKDLIVIESNIGKSVNR